VHIPETNEPILVVDDDSDVRRLMATLLRKGGFGVLSAGSGAEAIRLFNEHGASIRLLLTDVVMPEMSGPELVAHLLTLRPKLPVLYVSGYFTGYEEAMGGAHCVSKPFSAVELMSRIEQALPCPVPH
jgi:two-component system cell cycle sensor histidine kinase/response regulator CckA